jgi:MoaA/NifB/PqqE/SkfB family radical SAM enzyme
VKCIPPMRIKNWMRYLKNFTLNKFTNKKVPYSAQIELTLRCNAKCSFCAIPKIPNNLKSNEMNTSQVKSLIDQIADLGVNSLSFTGGEPTLRKDLPELIYHTGIVHDFMNGVATNGYLMPKLFKENGKLEGLDYILLSLDYPTESLHNLRRGINAFDKVMETINLAYSKGIKVILSTVVMKDNIHLLEEICVLAEKNHCSIELFPCENIIRDFRNQRYFVKDVDALIPNISKWADIILSLRKKFKNILTDPISIEVVKNGGFGGYPKYFQTDLRCHVAEAYLFVRFDGYVDYPCKIHPIRSFDALNHSLIDIYNSNEAKLIMKNHDNYQFCHNCRLGCAIASSLPTTWKTLYSKYILGYLKGNLK